MPNPIKEIKDKCRGETPDKIFEILRDSKEKYPDENGFELCDAASLFTAFAYFSENPADKNAFRAEAYAAFLNGDRSRFGTAWDYLGMLCGGKTAQGINVRILKGGSYKIKEYYLENNVLDDMRGASAMLSHAEERLIPDMIAEEFIRECIIYCGGGNIFAALPEWADERFALTLEARAQRVLLTAKTAYYISEPMPLSSLLDEKYNRNMTAVEERLAERKKLRIFSDTKPVSELAGSSTEIANVGIVNFSAKEFGGVHTCDACGKRLASYKVAEGGGDELLCGGCLHKRAVGNAAKEGRYGADYRRINGRNPGTVKTLADIGEDYISAVYADGNNMGGIIAGFTKITDMMSFSRDVRKTTVEAVFKAMDKVGIDRFEAVAIGGDDVFVIVPGKKAFAFTRELVREYNKNFYNKYSVRSTLSAGIATAKNDTPVKIMLEKAEEQLDRAKALEKSLDEKKRCGTLSFVIMDSNPTDGGDDENKAINTTMLPYTLETADRISEIVSETTSKTRLRNILTAFENASCPEEANLFLKYMNAKADKKNIIRLPEIDGYTVDGGYYVSGEKRSYIWGDLLTLADFNCKGDVQ